ncbi:Phosphate regulon transcriptional regulatory protein PhoB [bacterium HR33]|nr:Phosphate regulon transcriptional regulatory protein PhoB [bacterium HR33]
MQPAPTVLFYSPADRPLNELTRSWLEAQGYPIVRLREAGAVETAARRRLPVLILIDADGAADECETFCRSLKEDPYTAAIPVAMISSRHAAERVARWFEAGADEVITPLFEPAEQRSRLGVLIQRTERSLAVHPSTRLPGTTEIEREFKRRMDRQERFAVCYADIDHFKEFNDRYSYYDGDRVIYLLSRILRDVVKGLCPKNGFVGHIGGDDFIFVIEPRDVQPVCTEILDVFDTLIPYQYSPQDRRAGYFFGKDRRGHLHRVPLMTLSIGVVTNEQRRFQHPAQISELATEMKSYAKTLPGSVFVVDRRRDPEMVKEEATAVREAEG